MIRRLFLFSLLFALENKAQKQDLPIKVYARNQVEFNRQTQICSARGNAWADNGVCKVWADELKLYFHGKKVRMISAQGNVTLKHASGTLKSQVVTYNTINQEVRASGFPLSLETEKGKLTASSFLHYFHEKKFLEARGDVHFFHEEGIVQADQCLIWFVASSPHLSSLLLHHIEAQGHVRMETKERWAEASHGFYDAVRKKGRLWGNVSLAQGKDFARGEEAEMDFSSSMGWLKGSLNHPSYFFLMPKKLPYGSSLLTPLKKS